MDPKDHDEPRIVKKMPRFLRGPKIINAPVSSDDAGNDLSDDCINKEGAEPRAEDYYLMTRTIQALGITPSSCIRFCLDMVPIPFDHNGASTSKNVENYLQAMSHSKSEEKIIELKKCLSETLISRNGIQCRKIEFDEDEIAPCDEDKESDNTYLTIDNSFISDMNELTDLFEDLYISYQTVHIPTKYIDIRSWVAEIMIESKYLHVEQFRDSCKRPANNSDDAEEAGKAKRRRYSEGDTN